MSEAKPVWSKRVSDESINDLVVNYCAGRDVVSKPPADSLLVPFDLQTNAAHAIMLGDQGILSQDERKGILKALLQIKEEYEAGKQIIDPQAEDVHMSIEQRVTALTAEGMGGRLHTGRSRNDQVATDMLLWIRHEFADLINSCLDLCKTLVQIAEQHVDTPMPGMTHMQPAMLTSWGHAVAGYASRILSLLSRELPFLEQCPLGSAASFGSSWDTDRRRVATLLGFEEVSAHTTESIWERGINETRYGFLCTQILNGLSSIGQDLILYSTPPKQWIRLSHDVTTGSSIMPQKRNPDFAEVTRAKAGLVSGMLQSLLSLGKASPHGYNRDTQYSKYLVMDIADEVREAPTVFAHVFRTMTVDAKAMRAATTTGFLNATDVADFLARDRKLAFRQCYQILGKAVLACEDKGHLTTSAINSVLSETSPDTVPLSEEEMAKLNDPDHLLSLRAQAGSPNPSHTRSLIDDLSRKIDFHRDVNNSRRKAWERQIEALWDEARKIVNN